MDEQSEAVRELFTQYSKLIGDWVSYTEEKWRAVSDSQLGWKPLRGRWNGWEEIYRDSFSLDDSRRCSRRSTRWLAAMKRADQRVGGERGRPASCVT